MRTNQKRFLAAVIPIFQLFVILNVFPISATAERAAETGQDGLYTFYQADPDTSVTLDGEAGDLELWTAVPWAKEFERVDASAGVDDAHPFQTDYSARFKGLWQESGGKKYIYLYVEVKDATLSPVSDWRGDAIWFNYNTVDGAVKGEKHYWTATLPAADVTQTDHAGNGKGVFTYAMKDERGTKGVYTVEARFEIGDAAEFYFDLLTQDNLMSGSADANRYSRYAWNGLTASQGTLTGKGSISQKTVSELSTESPSGDMILKKGAAIVDTMDKGQDGTVTLPACESSGLFVGRLDANGSLYAEGSVIRVGSEQITLNAAILSFELITGASVNLENPASIRFGIGISGIDGISASITEAALLLMDASALSGSITEDHQITEDELTAAQIAFEKIVVFENQAVEKSIRYFGTKENVESSEQRFAASGSITVKYSDETSKTFYTRFDMADHCRSISDVAEKAYADRCNLRIEQNGVKYEFKVSAQYAVGDFMASSFSPYTAKQLDVLKSLYTSVPD